MKKIMSILILILALSIAVSAVPQSKTNGKSTMAQTTLVTKDEDWNMVWPAPFGSIKYDVSSAEEMKLQVHGLNPNTWHLVTFQRPDKPKEWWLGSDCLFGAKDNSWGSWCDVALFMTNDGGNANVIIPTTSGLTKDDLLVNYLGTGALAPAAYGGVTVSVKDVGCNEDCSTPDLGALLTGKTSVLYEAQAMETFVVP